MERTTRRVLIGGAVALAAIVGLTAAATLTAPPDQYKSVTYSHTNSVVDSNLHVCVHATLIGRFKYRVRTPINFGVAKVRTIDSVSLEAPAVTVKFTDAASGTCGTTPIKVDSITAFQTWTGYPCSSDQYNGVSSWPGCPITTQAENDKWNQSQQQLTTPGPTDKQLWFFTGQSFGPFTGASTTGSTVSKCYRPTVGVVFTLGTRSTGGGVRLPQVCVTS